MCCSRSWTGAQHEQAVPASIVNAAAASHLNLKALCCCKAGAGAATDAHLVAVSAVACTVMEPALEALLAGAPAGSTRGVAGLHRATLTLRCNASDACSLRQDCMSIPAAGNWPAAA